VEALRRPLVLAVALVAFALAAAGCATEVESMPDDPGGGFVVNSSGYVSADGVLQALQDDGWPVGDGMPTSPQFKALTGKTRCTSSKTFVRTGADRGWGFICLNMPLDMYAKVQDVFDAALVSMAPLYLDSGRDLVIFGFGWPGDSSEMFAETLGTTGTYLLAPR
jgi:hypothetical protein